MIISSKQKIFLSKLISHFTNVDMIVHIKNLIGAEHLCMGADYNGVGNVPNGMEDVSRYPYLIAELLKRGWTQDEVQGQLMHKSES